MKVNELISFLQGLDPTLEVVIMDADEGYGTKLKIMETEIGNGYVGLGGTYGFELEIDSQSESNLTTNEWLHCKYCGKYSPDGNVHDESCKLYSKKGSTDGK